MYTNEDFFRNFFCFHKKIFFWELGGPPGQFYFCENKLLNVVYHTKSEPCSSNGFKVMSVLNLFKFISNQFFFFLRIRIFYTVSALAMYLRASSEHVYQKNRLGE